VLPDTSSLPTPCVTPEPKLTQVALLNVAALSHPCRQQKCGAGHSVLYSDDFHGLWEFTEPTGRDK